MLIDTRHVECIPHFTSFAMAETNDAKPDGRHFKREVYRIGSACVVVDCTTPFEKHVFLARVMRVPVSSIVKKSSGGTAGVAVTKFPKEIVEYWKSAFRIIDLEELYSEESAKLCMVSPYGRVEISGPSGTGGTIVVKDELYRTMSHDSFCRIMALQELMVEGVLPITLTMNMFVDLEQDECEKLMPLVMTLPGFQDDM